MYVPILNGKEKARELIDVVREQTDAPIGTCINTVSIILSSLLRDLPDVYSLHVIKNNLERDDIIDVDNCYDAKVLKQLTASITTYIEDKCQLDWSIRNDEAMLVKSLRQFSGFLKKADIRVAMKRFHQDDYTFIEQLVSLYQMELKKSIRIELLSTFHSLCLLDRSVIIMLLCGQLPVLLVSQNNFCLPLTELDISTLQLLSVLFSTGEKFPTSHYDKCSEFGVFDEDNLDSRGFCRCFPIHFIIQYLRAVKLLMDIFCVSDDLIATLFYDNDLKVLYGILCQDLIDTNQLQAIQKMAMILQIMKNMEVIRRCGFTQEVYASVKTFLLTHEAELELRRCAESILQQVTEQQTNLPLKM
ncbi:unnamed protein product [Cercopithifilaria johnstoni]|uniref:SPIN90/Ldb17 leucine-rich domain-containing protein n=1 Tax=Cercopithifilaria johnstoni TaxID=2874296 RepID=A0A8J2Q413_9BILA|nr:unnamed protein product [Cercopithifilaria johnstoni]